MITIKEELIGNPKFRRAIRLGGHEAVTLWLAMKAFAAAHPTDGFVPADTIEEESERLGIKKPQVALKALLECGNTRPDGTRGPGLVDPHDHGCVLHDYLDHALSGDELVEKRERDKERKRLQRERAKLRVVLMKTGLSSTQADQKVRGLTAEQVSAALLLDQHSHTGSHVTSRDSHNESRVTQEDSHTESRDSHAVTSPARPPADGHAHAHTRERPRVPQPSPAQPNPGGGGGFATESATPTAQSSAGSRLAARLVHRASKPGEDPVPRHDPAVERIPFRGWFPSKEILEWSRKTLGLSDAAYDATMVELRDKHPQSHDFEWWDVKVMKFLRTASEQAKASRGQSPGGGVPWQN